jgi:hypothetical protein
MLHRQAMASPVHHYHAPPLPPAMCPKWESQTQREPLIASRVHHPPY